MTAGIWYGPPVVQKPGGPNEEFYCGCPCPESPDTECPTFFDNFDPAVYTWNLTNGASIGFGNLFLPRSTGGTASTFYPPNPRELTFIYIPAGAFNFGAANKIQVDIVSGTFGIQVEIESFGPGVNNYTYRNLNGAQTYSSGTPHHICINETQIVLTDSNTGDQQTWTTTARANGNVTLSNSGPDATYDDVNWNEFTFSAVRPIESTFPGCPTCEDISTLCTVFNDLYAGDFAIDVEWAPPFVNGCNDCDNMPATFVIPRRPDKGSEAGLSGGAENCYWWGSFVTTCGTMEVSAFMDGSTDNIDVRLIETDTGNTSFFSYSVTDWGNGADLDVPLNIGTVNGVWCDYPFNSSQIGIRAV